MKFYGIQKTSLVNFPEKISLVLFTGGCNLNCRYCYNKDLVFTTHPEDIITEEESLSIIKKRSSFIDAVVITGGEPAIQKDLLSFLIKIKSETAMSVKLDTNGFYPETLSEIISRKLADYIAVDIKTSPEKYHSLVNTDIDIQKLKSSVEILKGSNMRHEFRSTIVPGFFDHDDIQSIKNFLGNIEQYNIQQYINDETIDSSFQSIYPYSKEKLQEIRNIILTFSNNCIIKGL